MVVHRKGRDFGSLVECDPLESDELQLPISKINKTLNPSKASATYFSLSTLDLKSINIQFLFA